MILPMQRLLEIIYPKFLPFIQGPGVSYGMSGLGF